MKKTEPGFQPRKKDKTPADQNSAAGRYDLKGRLWVDGPEGTFIGVGRIVLLERIREHGSIIKAAGSMKMSYRHAWDLLDSMNRQSGRPLFKAGRGGRNGGGTELTPEGEKIIASFWELNRKFRDFLKRELKKLPL